MEYDNRGKVSLWKTDSQNPKAPVLSGKVVAHRDIKEGETLDLSLWKNKNSGNQPIMRGEMKDVFNSSAPAASGIEDDDLPF